MPQRPREMEYQRQGDGIAIQGLVMLETGTFGYWRLRQLHTLRQGALIAAFGLLAAAVLASDEAALPSRIEAGLVDESTDIGRRIFHSS